MRDFLLPSHDNSEAIIGRVCAEFEVPIAAVKGKSRLMHLVAARHECARRLYEAGKPTSEIIYRLGYNDHTGVRYGIRKAQERLNAVV